MRFSLKSGRTKSSHNINFFPEAHQHPDLPLLPTPHTTRRPSPSPNHLDRNTPANERFSSSYSGDRRSIAIIPGADLNFDVNAPYSPEEIAASSQAQLAGGLGRAQTVLRREGSRNIEPAVPPQSQQQPSPPPAQWSPDFAQLPTPSEQWTQRFEPPQPTPEGMSYPPTTPGKTSSDSGQSTALDRWSQRRLQRLNTEQGFREQRQGGGQNVLSPPASENSSYANTTSGSSTSVSQSLQYSSQAEAQPPQLSHPPQQPTHQSGRTAPSGQQPNAGLGLQTSSSSRPSNYLHNDSSQGQYSPPDSASQYSLQDAATRPGLTSSRSYSNQQGGADDTSMSGSNNAGLPQVARPTRTGGGNRQSMHNGVSSREGSSLGAQQTAAGGQQGGVAAFNAGVVPANAQGQPYGNAGAQQQQQQKGGDVGRATPQLLQSGEEMSEEDITQLIKEHKELREKYTKVKKYYFEKEDQVKQLQNSLAHQRLSQSRTSLDDSEYTTRFNRLDGLTAQLAFSIRKSWRSMPSWLATSVNKDAVMTGKQEMTAAGRAFISCWLVEEVFDKYFHPDLEPTFSAQLKNIQKNIRRFAPPAQTAEEEDYLTSKVVNWRLATLEGLQDALRSPQCPTHRAQLTDMLKENLIAALALHLQDPPPSDLEGGVHMIIELVVSIAIHLPLESRDVSIEYFMPGAGILQDQMKLESGIPLLATSIADDQADRASVKSAVSDATDGLSLDTSTDSASQGGGTTKKRGMLSALTGSGSSKSKDSSANSSASSTAAASRKHAGAGGSSSSLNRPDSSQGVKQDLPPRVRMAAGIGVQIRGRSVLVKAPVFPTA